MRIALGILWIGLGILYYQVLFFEPLTYDNPLYLSKHPAAQMPVGSFLFWKTLFLSSTANLWTPLTDLSHQLLYRFDSEPTSHHLFNVVLHGLNASLWLLLLRKIVGRSDLALALTLLFAWHPLTVESVAWISGRKDLLCTLFLTLATFIYHRRVSAGESTISWNFLLIAVLALLSKPIAFTLPFLLLAFDYWPLKRQESFISLLKEKWPLWLLSLLLISTTLYFQSQGTQALDDSRTFVTRITEALWALQHSLTSALLPIHLHFIYSNPAQLNLLWILLLAGLFLILFLLIIWKRRSLPFLVTGLAWYLITLGPTVGLIRAGNNLTADRYSYLPLLGLLLALAGILTSLDKKEKFRTTFLIASFTLATTVFLLTFKQISSWKTSETLFSKVIRHQPENLIAHVELAASAVKRSENKVAQKHLQEALNIAPESPGAHLILGQIAYSKPDYEAAYQHFEIASKIRTREAAIQERLAACAHGFGDLEKTRRHLTSAFSLARPQDAHLELEKKWKLIFPQQELPHS